MAPRVPRIDPGGTPTFAQSTRLRPTGEGQGLVRAGDALSRVGGELAREARTMAERDAALYGSRVMSNARSEWDSKLRAAQQAAPEGAPEFTPQVLGEFDTYAAQQVKDAPELIQPWLQQRFHTLRDDVAKHALEFETGARLNARIRNADEIMRTNANTVRNAPDQLAPLVGETRGMIESLDLPRETKNEMKDKAHGRLVRSYLEGLNQNDPLRAKHELEDGRWNAALSPEVRDVLATENAVEIRRLEAETDRARDQADARYRAEVERAVKDEIALIRETGQGGALEQLEPDALERAFGPAAGDVYAEIAHEKQFYIARTDVALTSPAEDRAYLEELNSQIGGRGAAFEIERRNTAVEAIAQKRKGLADDPARYVLGASPETAAAYDAAQQNPDLWPDYLDLQLSNQQQLGVPPHDRQLLGKGMASYDAAQIASAAPEDMADAIEDRRQRYGEDHWPTVWKELNAAGLPRAARILGIMDRPEDAKARVDFASALAAGDKDMKEILGTTATKDVNDQVASQLAEFYTSAALQGDGVRLAGDVQAATFSLALYYGTRGMEPAQAAKAAADAIVHSRYQFGPTYRVSAGELPQMERKADHALRGLQPDDMPALPGGDPNLSDRYRQEVARQEARRGYWVTNEDETGIYRVDQRGTPVMLKDGERLEVLQSDPIPAPTATLSERQRRRRGARTDRQPPEPPREPRRRGQAARREREQQ